MEHCTYCNRESDQMGMGNINGKNLPFCDDLCQGEYLNAHKVVLMDDDGNNIVQDNIFPGTYQECVDWIQKKPNYNYSIISLATGRHKTFVLH